MKDILPGLHISETPNTRVVSIGEAAWRMEIQAGTRKSYRVAQIDDHGKGKSHSPGITPPIRMSLQARVSSENIPGTWGFGLWNDPFSLLLGHGLLPKRLPALPNAAWFFHASPHSYLSFRDDLPGNGFLAATFRSKPVPVGLLAMASPVLAFSVIPFASQVARHLLRRIILQDAARVQTRVTEWHSYVMEWEPDHVRFSLDGTSLHQTDIIPHAPLSLVIWVDNQYASLPPRGRLKYGTLPNPVPVWMEIKDLRITN